MVMTYVNKNLRHGVRTTYIKHGCRCPECRKANSQYLKKYRVDAGTKSQTGTHYEYQKIARMALDWIIENQPEVYEQFKKGIANG